MGSLRIRLGPLTFTARWERAAAAPHAARCLPPHRQRIIQARWSGEAGRIPSATSIRVGAGTRR
jgi:hypothetical protein